MYQHNLHKYVIDRKAEILMTDTILHCNFVYLFVKVGANYCLEILHEKSPYECITVKGYFLPIDNLLDHIRKDLTKYLIEVCKDWGVIHFN